MSIYALDSLVIINIIIFFFGGGGGAGRGWGSAAEGGPTEKNM